MSSKTPQAIRGTQDIFGAEAEAFAFVVETFERVRKLYRFRPAQMPVFERTEVFARSIGETTDIVSKEMYSFEDRGGESLTLRPEFTAGIARAYITNGWQQHAPLKLATHGPLFRYERPQKGRYRQFHQLDAEIIGAPEPQADVELLAMADQLLKELGITEGVTLQLNTLGDGDSREAWRAALVEHFRAVKGELSEDSQERLEKNPLRILDSKDPRDQKHVDEALQIDQFLSDGALRFFEQVTAGLDAAGVKWQRNPALVRGLDYYRHTAFEFVTDRLGAQGTVLGGGRYDGLIESLGGAPTPAVGWAAGIERLAMLAAHESNFERAGLHHLAVLSGEQILDSLAHELTNAIRRNARSATKRKIPGVEAYVGRSRNKLFKKAQKHSGVMVLIEPPKADELATVRISPGSHGMVAGDVESVVSCLAAGGFDLLKEDGSSLKDANQIIPEDDESYRLFALRQQ